MFKLLVAGNAIGRMLAQLLQPSLENVIAVKCQEKFSLEATRVLLALKCYQLETGHLPGKLDELVPEYLDKVPVDDFDGKPLRYSKQKKIIYSVGKDLKDSGGGKVGKRTDMDEPTYAIEF